MRSSLSTELKVGITSILAIGILFGSIFWVKEYNPMIKRERITVLFNDARGINAGDPVNISGIKVGEVTDVNLNEDNRALVEFSVTKGLRLHSDCVFTIKDVGLMGDKAVIINPGNASDELDSSIVHMGTESSGLDDLITRADEVIQKLSRISTKIDDDLDIMKLTQSFEQTFKNMQQAIAIYEDIAQEIREPLKKSISGLDESAQELKHFIRSSDDRFGIAIESFKRTSDKISHALDTIENLSTVVDTLSAYMVSGEGTLGKLVKSGELYEELRQTNASIDSFITDFRLNPGKYTKDMQFKIRLF